MPRPYLPLRRCRTLLATAVVLSLVVFWLAGSSGTRVGFAQSGPPPPFRNFEAPQIHPLALTPDGTRLLAVNTPNASLSVFQLISGTPILTAEIPVGSEPVSVAARNDREAWVVNWLSDSVSIVDLTTGNVLRTIDVGDEPTDVVFAGPGNSKAFVCVSGGGRQFVGFSDITGATGAIRVFDANNPNPSIPTIIPIPAKQPRALARNADGSRVFVSVFESGNQTTIVPESIVAANGGLPPPNPPLSPLLPAAPNTSLIVKRIGSDWKDEIGRIWNTQIPFTLADVDLLVIDASSNAIAGRVSGIGTHIGNMAFDPSAQQLWVANLEDINQVRFEPNLRGRFQASRVSTLNATAATPTLAGNTDLNAHVDFGNPAGSDSERALSLTLPADMVRQSDGTIYVAATSSAKVGVLSAAGAVTDRIGVGQGPTGLAIDEARLRLYVLNRFDETISVVDTVSKAQLSQLSIGFNPEPAAVRNGRQFLYDATNLSSHGTVSCASCHLNGHRDGVAWDLGNPQGTLDPVVTFLPPNLTGADNQHPMKGPMMTQTLRGIIGNEPFHWRGDRAQLENFNGAFVTLLGGRLLTNPEMAAFKAFVQTLTFPSNPNHPERRTPNEFLGGGFGFFSTNKLFGPATNPTSGTINCSECHLITNFKVGSDNKITPSANLQETQSVKVAPFRGTYQKVGMDKTAGADKLTGFGFSHDGSFDTLFNFQKAPQFNFGQAGDPSTADSWRRSIEAMILQFDTGTARAVGMMATVDSPSSVLMSRVQSVLIPEAQLGNCDLVVRGLYGGVPRSFLRLSNGMFQPDSRSEAPITLQTLINGAAPGAELTFMGVPPGEGALFATDRDGNGVMNDDEPRTSVQLSGRVVDSAGNGIAGVVLTLSGKQAATAVTDSKGKFVFNFISTTGTHTVTPSKTGLNFTPSDRSFSNPPWNVSATFTTSPTGNVADVSQFFVPQHYFDFLNREPDASGLAFWTNEIESCGSNQVCRQLKRDNVSGAFFLSIEFKETGYLVYRTYKASFGDLPGKPVPITFQQLMTDTQRVGRNVIVTPPPDNAWQTLLETNKQAFFLGWVQRPDFLARFPSGTSAANFVDALNANTGGSLTTAERNALVNGFSDTTAGRASTLRQVVENPAFSNREFNKAFVLMQYFGYLRRNPDDIGFDGLPDPTFSGYNFWLTKLNEHNGNFIQAEMVRSFIVSIEYRRRFGL